MSPSPLALTHCSNLSGILPKAYMAQNQSEEEEDQIETDTANARC